MSLQRMDADTHETLAGVVSLEGRSAEIDEVHSRTFQRPATVMEVAGVVSTWRWSDRARVQ